MRGRSDSRRFAWTCGWAFGCALLGAVAAGACSRAYGEDPPGSELEGGAVEAGVLEGGAQTACTEGRTVCGGECTDTTSDRDNCGGCGKPCGGGDTCIDNRCIIECVGALACDGACVDPTTSTAHCGGCNKPCTGGTPYCVGGTCTPSCGAPNTPCGGDGGVPYCANLQTDPKNCGACGKVCTANETCSGAACKSLCTTGSAIGDSFAANMVGCTGKVGFGNRSTLCPAGSHVCSPQEWVARRAGKAPKYSYWTNANLGYAGDNGDCRVSATGGDFASCNHPMRVCGGYNDPLGNKCNWKDCGLETKSPNQFFGGCQGNTTAGALCCQ